MSTIQSQSRTAQGPAAPSQHVVAASNPPASVTRPLSTFSGLAGFVAGTVVLPPLDLSPVAFTVLMLAATAAPMLLVDILVFRVHRRPSTGLDWSRKSDFSLRRTGVKLAGLAATFAVLALGYWVFPEYKGNSYRLFFNLVPEAWPYVVIPAAIYITVVDAYMVQPKDGYWQAGCLALGRFSEVDRKTMVQYCLGWLVKGYFIPYITPILAPDVRDVVNSAFVKGSTGFSPFYDFAYSLAFTIDVVFASLGYLMTLRVADTHIRTTEPTTMGWLVCIMCYPPFSKTFYAHYYSYESNTPYWGNWTSSVHPLFYWTWGMAIVVCLFFYAWTSITFGCRFSNLTNRGILTNGPFRLTKHPHYVFKNMSWWLVVVPFVSKTTSLEAMRACLMLAAFNFIYFMRARTEERHLSQDPAYVAYALWINDNGLFSWLGRILPFLRYKPPAGVKGDADILPHRRAVS